MHGIARRSSFICPHCRRARASNSNGLTFSGTRHYAGSPPEPVQDAAQHGSSKEKEKGAMSRRLSAMSEESLESGGRSARKAVDEAGFSDGLKRQLEERIASASFRSEYASAFAQADMPSAAGRGTRHVAAAQPWTGTESVEDTSLRMLTDVNKPMRGPPSLPSIRGPPPKVDTGRSKSRLSSGSRLANARDKTSIYSFMKDSNVSEREREKMRQEMKERFQPSARAAPATIQGLASLANGRIEDAIARGQFKNLPRGKKIERDYNASSPFLDTTEYFMNKIIQKQDIVPPWIEKQQELVSTATKFRSRLQADWRRHVARTISSRGGSLQLQMQLAEEYAFAERIANPSKKLTNRINTVNEGRQLSQLTLAGEIKGNNAVDGSATTEIRVTEQTLDDGAKAQGPEELIGLTVEATASNTKSVSADEKNTRHPVRSKPGPEELRTSAYNSRHASVSPFRDRAWEELERPYQTLAVENLNSLTRSYNLMAPNLAKKPYFSLQRELNSCFSDVAGQVADAIKERTYAPKVRGAEAVGHTPGGVLQKFAMDRAKVYDERKPQYGFKQFWRDLFAKRPA